MRLPGVESIIILIFLISIALWAVSRCSSERARVHPKSYSEEEIDERPLRRDTVYVAPSPSRTREPASATPQQPVSVTRPAPKVENPAPTVSEKKPTADGTTLYVTIEGLKMRDQPGLNGKVVKQLELHEAVSFLNKKSENPQTVNLGTEKVTDYWVKVRTRDGKEGWVFGAGLHFFKTKRKPASE